MKVLQTEHLHLWTRTVDGAELGNAIYENDMDAAEKFVIIARQFISGMEEVDLTIGDVVDSLKDGGAGMYAGRPGLLIVVSRCKGGCMSSAWN